MPIPARHASRHRDYAVITQRLKAIDGTPGDRDQLLRQATDILWNHLHTHGISWLGFYIDVPEQSEDRRLILGPCRDKPACSPIGIHGLCGRALLTQQVCIASDVRKLGANYIACDPRDRSEIVVPLVGDQHTCWGVLDIDSHETDAFDESDARGLEQSLQSCGLLHSASLSLKLCKI
jgi:L-methionine (R)-S-oxide reductase